jgi:hypothetical protein
MLSCRFDAFGNGVMQRILEYHRYAEECRKIAASLVNPRHKQTLQEMAALIAFAALSTVVNPSSARAEATSPEMVACHKQAAQRYIADFRQVSTPQESFDGSAIIVTKFQNDNEQYEKYLAECMKREKKSLARPPAYSAGEIWLSEQSRRATNVLAFAL